jgi:hypothetical protein
VIIQWMDSCIPKEEEEEEDIAHLGWETPVFFYTFYLVYIWHCHIKLFLRHLPNCPCSYFSPKVSPVLFTSVSQTFDDFCRQKCFTSPCLAKNKQVMATQSKLVCLKLIL